MIRDSLVSSQVGVSGLRSVTVIDELRLAVDALNEG